MRSRFALLMFCAASAFCADWSPRLAADYLDARQKEWFAWPIANGGAKPCISCHTGATYLLARPALRRALGENEPTVYETGLRDSLNARVGKTTASDLFPKNKDPENAAQASGVEAIFAAAFLGTEPALDRMWSMQARSGAAAGGWPWFSLDLDPWEMPESSFYGAALAAYAVGSAPAAYRDRPDVRERVAALNRYFEREMPAQPLQNRLMLLWASARLEGALPASQRKSIVEEVWRKQQGDGGWTLEALGSWKKHEKAPIATGSNAYATGFTAWTLESAGVGGSDARMGKALDWLKSHQDRQTGSWTADSMNKPYPPGSMMLLFMRDAATAYASLALLGSK